MAEPGWAIVIPVKRLDRAKTRLRGAVPAVPHEQLVLALAQDTVRAVLACPLVVQALAVTDDPSVARALTALGARVVPDAPGAGLNPAITYAAGLLPPQGPMAALTADLPALRPTELGRALQAMAGSAAPQRGFVPDAAGTGTTLLAVTGCGPLDPQFGPGSAARHAASGARALAGSWPGLRRDVDTAADLAEAARLGLGPHTAALQPLSAGSGRG